MFFKGIKLSLLIGNPIPVPVPYNVIEALTNVKVTVGQEQASGFELKFSVSKRADVVTQYLVAGGIASSNIRVVIVATMGGIPNVLIDGVITKHQLAPGLQGNSTLSVQGRDLTHLMNQQELDGTPFPALPSSERVRLLVGKYSQYRVVPAIIPEIFKDVPNINERVPMQKGTDLAYINELAEQAGYTFYIDPGRIPGASIAYWGPKVKVSAPQKALNVDFDAHSNVDSISFSFESDKRILPITLIQNPETKLPIPIPGNISNPLTNPPLGAITPGITGVKITRDSGKMTLSQAMQKALGTASSSESAVKGSGSLNVLRYGAILKARQLVGVRGAGRAYDGLYYVDSVTHNIARGEYKQDFSVSRNGLVSTVPRVRA